MSGLTGAAGPGASEVTVSFGAIRPESGPDAEIRFELSVRIPPSGKVSFLLTREVVFFFGE